MTVFGVILTGRRLRRATVAHVQTWFPTYLAEMERQEDWAGDLPNFRSFVSATDVDAFTEDQFPVCVVVAPGLADPPVRHGSEYSARWAVNVAAILSGQDRDNTFELTEIYTAALRSLLVQHPSIGGMTDGVTWLNERYDELPTEDSRTIAAGIVQTTMDVTGVVDSALGPLEPGIASAEWPVVENVFVRVESRE